MKKNKRIAIFGGTFNPVHKGHMAIAREAFKKLQLDRVYFVPAYLPPHKYIEAHVTTKKRVSMVRLALKPYPAFSLSRYETARKKISYSIDTIRYFRKRFGKSTELFFIIGSDSLKGIEKWKEYDKITSMAKFVVFTRPGYALDTHNKKIKVIKVQGIDVASTDIRKRVKNGKSVKHLLPIKVSEYIRNNKLYT